MTLLLSALALILHAALILAAAPITSGIARLVKARLIGKRGAPVLQPWRDLRRLARKEPVLAESASMLFTAVPSVIFTVTFAAALLVPGFCGVMLTAPLSDLLAIAGLLGIGRVSLILAGLDVGTAFGGIGASREATFAVFSEPALLLVFFTLALLAGTTNLDAVAALLREGAIGLRVSLGLAFIAAIVVGIVENGRVPVDNPATHLEVTMVHEAMVLEYSGRHLALIEAAGQLRLVLFLSLIGTIFFPFFMALPDGGVLSWLIGIAVWAGKLLALSVAIGVLEASIAKMRVFRVPEFLGVAVLLALLAAVFLFVSTGFV